MEKHQYKLISLLSLLLMVGFVTTSLISYSISIKSMRDQISQKNLPLTSDNIYSEIQKDLLIPIFVSSMMANDTFLRDWIINGEKDPTKISKFLNEVKTKYNTVASFYVSEKKRIYYYGDGILKKVDPNEERDIWYFRVSKMEADYEINVDPDMANQDSMTIFINHKVFDYEGNYLGATGVGLTVNSVKKLTRHYHRKYNRQVYFMNQDGAIVLQQKLFPETITNIRQLEGINQKVDEILGKDSVATHFRRDGKTVYLNSRFIPELNWYIMVEELEEKSTGKITRALIVNLVLCAVVSATIISLVILLLKTYQKKMTQLNTVGNELRKLSREQEETILKRNAELESALLEVKELSGLLPICSSCKKIRDDKGYWNQIEAYISHHTRAEFTHGICPECATKLYPEFYNEDSEGFSD